MKFSDKYPNAEPFQEPMEGIFVAPDYYPCVVCSMSTRFIDYLAPSRPAALCSDECAITYLF